MFKKLCQVEPGMEYEITPARISASIDDHYIPLSQSRKIVLATRKRGKGDTCMETKRREVCEEG